MELSQNKINTFDILEKVQWGFSKKDEHDILQVNINISGLHLIVELTRRYTLGQ